MLSLTLAFSLQTGEEQNPLSFAQTFHLIPEGNSYYMCVADLAPSPLLVLGAVRASLVLTRATFRSASTTFSA